MVAHRSHPAAPTSLRGPEHRPHRLPAQPTPLVGRDNEITALQSRLLEPDTRLLTLTGPPGTGKTRLAIAVAGEVAGDFADGVWFVALETVHGPDGVIPAVAQALGLRETGGQPLVETLATHLRDKQALLVLDNFEQVLPAAGPLAELLAGSPGLTVLVTSRTRLRLRWEHEFPVAPLALPDPAARSDLTAVGRSPAVELFRQRAVAARPDFDLSAANVTDVARICAALDGLPLAIELAAARITLLPPRAILERLQPRLTLLTGGARDLPDRHRTLRAAIAWSYDLLSTTEQALFRQMGVFVGGCSFAAAEAVAGGLGDGEAQHTALDLLSSLADQSLLRRDGEAPAEPRLRMLETIREFAREQLVAAGELADTQQRHATYFLALAEAAEPHLAGAEQAAWLDRLEAEHDNIGAALVWALEQGEPELGLRLGGALWRFWVQRGPPSEGHRHLAALLALPGAAGHPAPRAKALNAAGNLAMTQGDHRSAGTLYEQSLELWRELGRAREVAASLNNLGIVAEWRGEYARSRRFHEESLAVNRQLGDRLGIAISLSSLGSLAILQGDYAAAQTLYAEGLAMRRELHDDYGIRVSLNNLGMVAYLRGEYALAFALHEQSLTVARAVGDKYGIGDALNHMGWATLRQGNHEAARTYMEDSLTTYDSFGDTRGLNYALEGLAALAAAEGRPERAARLFGAAQAIRDQLGLVQSAPERALHELDVAVARAALDEATLAAAWVEGAAMPREAALAYALSDGRADAPATDHPRSPLLAPRSSLPGGLTAREAQVLRLIATGRTNREIAEELVLAEGTVERHISNIYAKIGARRRADATAYAFRHTLAGPAET